MAQATNELQGRIEALERLFSRTRHDIRSALAPAMLAADMLATNPDPKVQRNSATVLRAIDRVLAMLDGTKGEVASRPDRDPAGQPTP